MSATTNDPLGLLVDAEMAAYYEGEYMDHSVARERLRDFAAAVQAAERERCAKLVDPKAPLPAHVPGSGLPVYVSNATREDREAKRALRSRQIRHLVSAPQEQQIWMTCGCGARAVVWKMYQCLYCGIYYCKVCAEQHFGARRPAVDEDYHQSTNAQAQPPKVG